MQESSLFGNRKPDRAEWLKHTEIYGSLANTVDPSHITGLQRVNDMWRIYVDNLDDKVALLSDGIMIRGKHVKLLNTNPNRLDSEQTLRVRIKNIPLSVDDGSITRPLILKGLDVISTMREKLRYNGKLTNCETGDRIVTVKATSVKTPLPRTMAFGKFVGRVIHYGQNESKVEKCKKCLDDGHITRNCPNDWKCLVCHKTGHKKGDCDLDDDKSNRLEVSAGHTVEDTPGTGNVQNDVTENLHEEREANSREKKTARRKNKKDKNREVQKGQQLIKSFCENSSQETPNKGKSTAAKNRTPPTPEEQLKKSRKCSDRSSDSDQSDGSSTDD